MTFILVFLFSIVSWAQTAPQLPLPTKIFASYTKQESALYNGNSISAGLYKNLNESLGLGAEVTRLTRTYDGNVTISDSSYALQSAYDFKNGRYLEAQWSYSANPSIYPVHWFSLTPRQVFGRWDLGIGLDYRKYANVAAGSLHPNFVFEANPFWTFRAGVFIVRERETLTAGYGEIVWKIFPTQFFKFGGAGGKTLEDAGLSAGFKSGFVGYEMNFVPFYISLEAGRYWSDTRYEHTYGLKVGLK